MSYAIQWVRSLVFNITMYIMLFVIGLVYTPAAIWSANGAVAGCHMYVRFIRWSARWMIGLDTEIRGNPPTEECMVASKHMSFLDVLLVYGAVPRGKFIFKDILKYAPFLGQFGLRIGCIPVKRGKRGAAIKKMLADVEAGTAHPGQLLIYPQGTRVGPGEKKPYKIGTAALYTELDQRCYPVACNVGVFWPKRGVYRKPGTAVMEFMDPIEPGIPTKEFIEHLEILIETRSNELMHEAGFDG